MFHDYITVLLLVDNVWKSFFNIFHFKFSFRKSNAFLFQLKMDDIIIEKSVAEKMFQNISSDSFKFPSLRARFLMSARIECAPAAELALKSEEVSEDLCHFWLNCFSG